MWWGGQCPARQPVSPVLLIGRPVRPSINQNTRTRPHTSHSTARSAADAIAPLAALWWDGCVCVRAAPLVSVLCAAGFGAGVAFGDRWAKLVSGPTDCSPRSSRGFACLPVCVCGEMERPEEGGSQHHHEPLKKKYPRQHTLPECGGRASAPEQRAAKVVRSATAASRSFHHPDQIWPAGAAPQLVFLGRPCTVPGSHTARD